MCCVSVTLDSNEVKVAFPQPTAVLTGFGFKFSPGGPHISRTMMLHELTVLLATIPGDALSGDYADAIVGGNVLNKGTESTRLKTLRHLRELYALSPSVPIFYALRQLQARDATATPQLALLCAWTRDPMLRATTSVIFNTPAGMSVPASAFADAVAEAFPDHYSDLNRQKIARNARATWIISSLMKLLYPDPGSVVADDALEWATRLALECRRRVKEQQKRIGSAEFRNTHFSYTIGENGVEKFVATPELYSEDSIGSDPLPPGQVWALSPGGSEENPGLYRIDATEGPGSGVRILNQPTPAPFRESIRCAEQNLYVHAKSLVGDRDPRAHEFSAQLRAYDTARNGASTGVGALLALCSALLQKSLKGGMVVVGGLNLGGSIEPIFNAVNVVELGIEKGATSILLPVSARRQLNDLPDDLATKAMILYYSDARDALLKALVE